MEPRSVVPRVGRPLLSIGLGVMLVWGMLWLLGGVTPSANAAPVPPQHPMAPLVPQAIIPVTTTIQAAIDAASAGDTVEFTGTYTEEVVINKSLTLRGTSPTAAIVYNGVFPFPAAPTIRVTTDVVTITNMTLLALGFVQHSAISVENSSNVNITGVTIQNYPTGIEVGRTVPGPTGITITNNIIQYSDIFLGEGGIYFLGSGTGIGAIQATVQSNQVSGYTIPPLIKASGLAPSLIASNVLTAPGLSPDGIIYLDKDGSSVIQDNRLIAITSTLIGIHITGSANPTITQNILDSQILFGIQVDSSAAPVITNSTLSGHNPYGIYIFDNAQPQIFNTNLLTNTIGLNISGNAQPQIFDSVMSGNTAAGILANPTITPTIARNRIIGNANGIAYRSPSPATTFAYGNTICQNTLGLTNTSSITLNVTGNWWGHNPPLTPADFDGDPVNTSPISMALSLNPTPAVIPLNGTVDITLTMRGGGYNVLDGTGINFTASAGSFSTVNTTTLNGLATTIYTGTVLGTHVITAADECGGIVTDTIIVGEAVLTTTKTADPLPGTTVRPGQAITYTIYVTNTGAYTATGVVFSDTIPAFTQLAAATIDAGTINLSNPISATFSPISPNNGVMSVTVRVTVTLPLTNGILLTNTGAISYFDGTTSIITPTNSVTHLVQSAPDITLTKTALPPDGSPVSPGNRITYTITLTNNGTADATNAVLTDTVPQYTQYVAGTASPAPVSTSPLVWNLGPIGGAGGVVTVTFAVQVDLPLTNALTISNSALLDIAETTGLSQTNVVTHLVQSSTDITFTKLANPPSGSQVSPGDTLTYTLVAANIGTQMATGVVMTDSLPAEVNVVISNATKAPPPSVVGNLFTWNIGTLTANETVTATIQVTVTTPMTRGTVITNQGQLLTNQTGLSTTNFVTHTVISTPTLTLNKSTTPPSGSGVFPGQTITYTIAVTNSGNGPATNFLITDTVPVSTSLMSNVSATPGFTVITNTGALTVSGTLGAGQSMVVTFAVTVSTIGLSQGDVLTNTGYVSYAESPVISPTNSVTHVIRLTPALTLTKMADPPGPTIGAGQMITYTVIISNDDIFDASNVVLTDFIPANTNYVSGSFASTQGITNGPDPLQVTVGTLTGGQVMSFTFQVTVTIPITNGIVISNVAQMSADYLSVVNSNQVTHTVVATPQLTLIKSNVPPNLINPGDLLDYTLTLRNDGGGNATNVIITDVLPNYVSVFSPPRPPTITMSIINSTWVITIPNIPGGGATEQVAVTLRVTSPLTNDLVITNVATYVSDQTPISASNVVTNIIQSQPVLSVTKSADPPSGSSVNPGQAITYTIRVEHDLSASTENAPNVVITDTLPPNTNYVAGSANTMGGVNPTAAFTSPNVIGHVDWLPLGEVMTLTYVVTVTQPLTDGTLIQNIAFVDSDRTGLQSSFPFVTHTVQSQVILTYTKSAQPPAGPITPGDTITYTLTFTNSGSSNATGLVITDVVPTYANYIPGSASATGSALESGGVVTFTGSIPGLNGVFTATFAVTVTTPLTNGLNIVNVAQFSTAQTGVVSQTNTVTHTVVSNPVLTLTKSANPPSGSSVSPGDPLTYTITLTNSGTAPATGVIITDVLDPNVILAGVTPSGAVSSTSPLMLDVGTVAANGGTVSYTVQVTVTSPLTNGIVLSNQAQVTSAGVPTVTLSNQVTHTVVSTPNLIAVKNAVPPTGSTVDPTDGINYVVQFINTGNGPATNVVITDTIPVSTTLFSASLIPPIGTVITSSARVTVTIPSLAGGGGLVTLLMSVNVDANATPGLVITNAAQIDSDQTVLTSTNTVTHMVRQPANLLITKLADPLSGTSVRPNETITYTLTVVNIGAGTANNMTLTDFLPSGVTYVPGSVSTTPGFTVLSTLPTLVVSGTLLPAATMIATFRVTVSTVVSGTVLTNTAQVSATATSPVSATTTHLVVNPTYNLAITKNANPASGSTVEPGNLITYTVTVVNNGDPVTNVVISDTLDPNVTLVTSNTTAGILSGPNPVQVTLSNLGAGQAVTITLEVQVSGAASGTIISNQASVTATEIATLQVSGVVTHLISNTIPVPSLVITKTATPASGSSVGPNSTITYTITVANSGSGDATNVVITDTLPITWVNLVSASLSNGGGVAGTNPLVANVGTLTASTSVTLTIVVTTSTVATDTLITNTAQVVADTLGVQTSSAVTHVITATPPALLPSLTITKTAVPISGSVVEPGDFITYTLTVQNSGAGSATNVIISDMLDPNVGLVVSSTTTGILGGPNPVQVTGFNLNPGQGVTVTLGVTVTGSVSGTVISNQANVTSTETAVLQVSGVVTHLISSTIVGPPSFAITKSANPAGGTPVIQNDIITYTVVVINTGGPATNVVLTDVIPANTAYVASSVTSTLGIPNFDGTQVMVNVANFPAGGTLTTTFQVRVTTNLTTTITNTATLDSDQTAPQNSNSVIHPVQGTGGGSGTVYLPIIYKNFSGSYAILQWDGGETICDKVSDLDGGAGLILDGRTDGVFWFGVDVGSEGPKAVADIRLSSTQPGVEWDTIVGNGPLLGVFSGGSPLNDPGNGTISGVLFNPGPVWVQLWASDDTGQTRFVPNQYVYTVTINFTDSSSLSAQTSVWSNRPAWCP